ncbi:class I adenylate-forming enzyme family protein [Limobrevibacterium gyesilva]|uniref:Acyl--CoA ligase n=1 Tax=Limobrevibacterium gyesilva TaxID=2991712 RepID=A0AA41YKS9_9PROT|nr:class I adenylate-forming enzyme family protein [Limobrevibacterium gyesilva]MCW3474037.1 acyl--CoA ligase [Limobrevibacterium gyesilva]
MMPLINWGAVQATLVHRFGPRVAVRDAAGDATYAEVFAAAAGLGRRLIEAGVRPGEHVATFLRNGRAAVSAAYGTQLAGAAETPLNISYTEAELAGALGLAGCRHVVCGREHAALFGDLGLSVHVMENVAPEPLAASRFPSVASELPGRLAFTSGTTGLPKAIVYSQRARFLANLLLQASLPWLPGPGSRMLMMTPFAHGASLQTFAWLDQGGEAVLLDGVQPDRVEKLLADGAPEGLFAAPTVLAKLTVAFAGRHFPGVRTIFTGTAPLPPLLYERVRAMFGPVVRLTYGKSEVFNPITVLQQAATDAYYAAGGGHDGRSCVGWPAAGVELAIEDGEVLIRAQHMSEGWIDASGFHSWRADGFHATGDIGEIDAHGRLFLTARLSDAMKTGGYKVYPQEIERTAAPAAPGSEIAVVGFPSEYWGEIIIAVAENPPDGWEAAARATCAGLAPFKRPRFYVAVDALPRNGQGKMVRRQLLAELQARYRLTDGPRPAIERI